MLGRRTFLHRSPFVVRPPEIGPRRWLIAELDRLTSLIVRRRGRRCVTCGEGPGLRCSHFYPRQNKEDTRHYLEFMNERHGPGAVAKLATLRGGLRKVGEEELREVYERHRAMF